MNPLVTPRPQLSRLPNALSWLRFALAPVLLGLALFAQADAFLILLLVSFSTDVADGYLARRFGVATEQGAKLDSRADLATWTMLPFATWFLMPDFVEAEIGWITILGAALMAVIAAGLVRWGRMASYHTWGAKLSAVLLAGGLVAVFAGAPVWPLRVAAAIAFLSMLEELAITAILPRWTTDVPSVWHALKLR